LEIVLPIITGPPGDIPEQTSHFQGFDSVTTAINFPGKTACLQAIYIPLASPPADFHGGDNTGGVTCVMVTGHIETYQFAVSG